jgi:hypothetical protein
MLRIPKFALRPGRSKERVGVVPALNTFAGWIGTGLLFVGILTGCAQNDPPVKGGSCPQYGATACLGDEVLICGDGNEWQGYKQCQAGMCTRYSPGANVAPVSGCRAPGAQCNGSLDRFCSDNMVVWCTTDGQPIIVDSCPSSSNGAERYCVVPNDGTPPDCSFLPAPCPETAEHVCINVGLGKSGHEGIVDCNNHGLANLYRDYNSIDGESCTLRPCSVEGQMGCIGSLSGSNKPVQCIKGLWLLNYDYGRSCSCDPSCL